MNFGLWFWIWLCWSVIKFGFECLDLVFSLDYMLCLSWINVVSFGLVLVLRFDWVGVDLDFNNVWGGCFWFYIVSRYILVWVCVFYFEIRFWFEFSVLFYPSFGICLFFWVCDYISICSWNYFVFKFWVLFEFLVCVCGLILIWRFDF